jgi:hypothetical protein
VRIGFNGYRRTILFLPRTVAREGIEEPQDSQGKSTNTPETGAYLTDSPDSLEVRAAWPSLTEGQPAAILAIVRDAGAPACIRHSALGARSVSLLPPRRLDHATEELDAAKEDQASQEEIETRPR